MLDSRLLLGGQDVVLDGRDGLILRELVATIVRFARVREDLDDQKRVEERVAGVILEKGLTADDDPVGVDVAPGGRDLDTQVGAVDLAAAPASRLGATIEAMTAG